MNKVHIKTWGCQMNEYDSEKILSLLKDRFGAELEENAESSDILILNTCSIREKAQEKLFHQLGRWRELKEVNKNLIICVGGCVASQEGARIRQRAPYVDIIFGPQTLHRLPAMIEQLHKGEKAVIDISFPEIEKFDSLPVPEPDGVSAFVSIMEGCNKYCSYCVVPYTRGEEMSRPLNSVLLEILQLAQQGVREINLLGQNVNAYRGPKEDGTICSFAELLRIVASIDGVDRLRFITSHPLEFSDDIIEAYVDIPELCDFLHLPVQSGSDDILNAMKRGYTSLEYKSIIRKLRKVRPNMHISSDFIVGFPGETDEDHEKTMDLIRKVNFDMSFSFIFSARPGTPAADLPDDTPEEVKKQRLQELQHQINVQAQLFSREMLGATQRVLVEGVSKKNVMELTGKSEFNRAVNFVGSPDLIGKFVDVKITDVFQNSLRGEIICVEGDGVFSFNSTPISLELPSDNLGVETYKA
ncbi:MAG: tRNA (N6-isopentenyl adenosine(37)-C2)-methylthiotransferase MiaB [Psittacicella sp.]